MGLGISRMGQRSPLVAGQAMNRPRITLASLLCGTSFDDDPPQLEEQSDDSSSTALESPPRIGDSPLTNDIQESAKGSSSAICSQSTEADQSHNGHNNGVSSDFGSSVGSSLSGKHLLRSKEEVIYQRNGDDHQESSLCGLDDQASSSTMPVSVSSGEILSPITDEHSTSNQDYQNTAGRSVASNVPQRNLPANSTLLGNQVDVLPGAHRSCENLSSASSVQSAAQHSLEEESDEGAGAGALDPGLFIPLRARPRRSGSILHVDIVSISSNVFSRNSGGLRNHEARRNSRRLFRDAFSRRSSERDDGSPSMLFSSEDEDDLASHDRWLFNLSSDFFGNGETSESDYHSRHSSAERRWRSRSEIREALRDGLDEHSERPTLCASGLHPDGTCSCETFLLAEGSGARASISRIVMLAEALFEVLDEIHRQPVPLSLSMVSQPAPESLVDSFPLKIHRKSSVAESGDVEQCYICLAEYEEGDRIRVLPCRHEYHMPCVDKWLKEIHGVCPLCRGDVCNGVSGCPTSTS